MLRSLSRAGSCSSSSIPSFTRPSSHAVRLVGSARPSLSSLPSSAVSRRYNATESEAAGASSAPEAAFSNAPPATSAEESSQQAGQSIRGAPRFPGVVRLPPYTEMLQWRATLDYANLVNNQIQADADKSGKNVEAAIKESSRLVRRLSPSLGVVKTQLPIIQAITKAVADTLPPQATILALGPVSWESAVSGTHPRLGLRPPRSQKGAPPMTRDQKHAELQSLVPALKQAGFSAHVREGVLRVHRPLDPSKVIHNKAGRFTPTKVTLSHVDEERIIGNAIIGSYMALSPHLLVPLVRAVNAIPQKLDFCMAGEYDSLRAVMAICYLQSLPMELLPNLQQPLLLKEFRVPRQPKEFRTTLSGKQGTATVDTSFLPVGVSPGTLAKVNFMNEDREVHFVKSWRKKAAPSLAELVSGFYYWYAGEVPGRFDWATNVVSVKGRRTRASADPEGNFEKDAMVVLDPANPYINLAAGFTYSKDVIKESFMECLRDELVSADTKLEDLFLRHDSVLSPQSNKPRQPPAIKKVANAASAAATAPAGVEALEAAVPQKSAPEGVKETAKEEVKKDAATLTEQIKEKVEQGKEKVKEVKEKVEEKIEEVKKD